MALATAAKSPRPEPSRRVTPLPNVKEATP
jgi:hypothetical protein